MVSAADGTLELRRSELMTLAALAGPNVALDSIDLEDLDRLRAVGAVEGTALTEGARPIAETVRSPVVRLRLDFLRPGRPVVCPGWIDSRFAVLAVPSPSGVDDVKVAPTAFLPARLAGFTGLGPRPVNKWSWDGGRAEFDASLAQQESPTFVPARSLRLHWRVTMAWTGGSRSLEVLDANDAGIWLVRQDEQGDAVSVVSVTTTDVWVALIATLPTGDEIENTSFAVT